MGALPRHPRGVIPGGLVPRIQHIYASVTPPHHHPSPPPFFFFFSPPTFPPKMSARVGKQCASREHDFVPWARITDPWTDSRVVVALW